jgi:four helix bundle protein
MGVGAFHDLRAWQTARTFKLAVYRLSESSPLCNDPRLRNQLRETAASAVSQVAEGFGRFNPKDFARFLGMAKASLIEAQNHLQDAVDRRYITEETKAVHHELARAALADITSLLEYLQSPKATQNAQGIRNARQNRTPSDGSSDF